MKYLILLSIVFSLSTYVMADEVKETGYCYVENSNPATYLPCDIAGNWINYQQEQEDVQPRTVEEILESCEDGEYFEYDKLKFSCNYMYDVE